MAYRELRGAAQEWCWDPPQRRYNTTALAPAIPAGRTKPMIGVDGQWAHCRAWVNVPAAWAGLVFQLIGKVGAAEVVLDRRSVADSSPTSQDGGVTFNAIVGTAAGYPCDGFELRLEGDGAGAAGTAQIAIMAWGEELPLGGGAGALEAAAQRVNVNAGVAFTQAQALAFPARVKMVYGLNTAAVGTPTLYMQLHNTLAVLVGGEVPAVTAIAVNPTQNGSWSVPDGGDWFATGLRVALSTAPATFVAAGANLLATVYYDT